MREATRQAGCDGDQKQAGFEAIRIRCQGFSQLSLGNSGTLYT